MDLTTPPIFPANGGAMGQKRTNPKTMRPATELRRNLTPAESNL